MHPLVEVALNNLSVTCFRSAVHPQDEDRIKVTLKALKKHQVELDLDEVERWLVSENWDARSIQRTIKWARTIMEGGTVQLKNKAAASSEKEIWTHLNR